MVGRAVTSLQFQDMVGQLIQHSLLEFRIWKKPGRSWVNGQVKRNTDKLHPQEQISQMRKEINDIFAEAERLSERSPVNQKKVGIK